MLHTVAPWNLVAKGYARTTMQLFKCYIETALQLVQLTPDARVLDVACGPGTLAFAAAKQAKQVDAIDFSPEMVRVFQRLISQQGITNIRPLCADGQQLPFQDDCFDAAFSMFGLMFFPNRQRGYAEILRTLKSGGKVALSSWAPISQSPAMQAMFGALRQIKPDLPEPQRNIASLENPDFFHSELEDAGFCNIKIHPVTGHFPVDSVEHFWQYMVQGSAPIVMMRNNMAADDWAQGELNALNFLRTTLKTPTSLSSDAWLAIAEKP